MNEKCTKEHLHVADATFNSNNTTLLGTTRRGDDDDDHECDHKLRKGCRSAKGCVMGNYHATRSPIASPTAAIPTTFTPSLFTSWISQESPAGSTFVKILEETKEDCDSTSTANQNKNETEKISHYLNNLDKKKDDCHLDLNLVDEEQWGLSNDDPLRLCLVSPFADSNKAKQQSPKTDNQSTISRSSNLAPREQTWRAAVDPNSGRTYYYDAITRETQWRKPLALASFSERRKIQEKEARQRDFFRSMEANILKAMDKGALPGVHVQNEDVVRPLPMSRKPKKPNLIRTISSMDDDLLAELSRSETPSGNISPDSTSTSFFDSLPQPGHQWPKASSKACGKIKSSSPLCQTEYTSRSPSNSNDSPAKMTPRHEVSKNIPKPAMGKRNTCGSLFISDTMADPDKDAAIMCLCGVYRTHIVQSTKEESNRNVFEEYEVFNDNYEDRQPPPKALIMEGIEAIEMMQIDKSKAIPSIEEISNFYRYIFKKAQMETDCIIMSLIYVERLLRETKGGVRPNIKNWKSVLFSCMVLSSKVWDDLSMWNNDFSQALPKGIHFSLQRINKLELALLTCLKYNVKVPASEYAKYYFLMRSMMIRSGLAGQEILAKSPLDVNKARQLEFLTSKYNDTGEKQHAKLTRSRSVDGFENERDSNSPPRSSQVSLEQVVRM